jgi:hypothetical protein
MATEEVPVVESDLPSTELPEEAGQAAEIPEEAGQLAETVEQPEDVQTAVESTEAEAALESDEGNPPEGTAKAAEQDISAPQ